MDFTVVVAASSPWSADARRDEVATRRRKKRGRFIVMANDKK